MEQDSLEGYFVATYDEIGSRYDTAQTFSTLRKETVERIRDDIESGRVTMPSLDIDEWIDSRFRLYVDRERTRRSNHMNKNLDWLLDGFSEDGAYLDPVLGQMHRLGDRTDKILRLWTADDWHEWGYRRLKNGADHMAAANSDADKAEQLIEQMRNAGVTFTGDLYEGNQS